MLNAAIKDIPLPERLAKRPISKKGFPIPWFVTGEDFVNIHPEKIVEARRRNLCWLCGEPLGSYKCFVIGPMCSINRISAEPPTHRDCAEYAVRACPFLVRPNMKRNEAAALVGDENVPGVMLQHNPGVTLIWITKSYRVINGLFQIGDPVELHWYTEGRTATRAEIDAAIAKGLPFLQKIAEEQGHKAVQELKRAIDRQKQLLRG